jgi:hypothetical protein
MISDGEDFEILEPSFVVGGHQKWSSYFGKQSVIPQLNMKLPFDLEIPLVSIYPKEIKHIFIKTML